MLAENGNSAGVASLQLVPETPASSSQGSGPRELAHVIAGLLNH